MDENLKNKLFNGYQNKIELLPNFKQETQKEMKVYEEKYEKRNEE